MRGRTLFVLVGWMVATSLLAGCGNDGEEGQPTLSALREKAGDYWSAIKSFSLDQKEQLIAATEDEIESLKKRYRTIAEKAAEEKDGAEGRWGELKEKLETRIDEAEKRLDTLQKTGADEWKDAKKRMADGLSALSTKLEEAAAAVKPAATAPAADADDSEPASTDSPA